MILTCLLLLRILKKVITIDIFHIHSESKDDIGGVVRNDIIKY